MGSNDRYFGVFNVNLTALAYTATYNYNGNPFVTPENEADISLFKRTNNGALHWENANANLNAAARTLTVAGQNTEYMLGVLHCGNATPVVTASGPLNFCHGGNVTLTCTPAKSYLWSNGAITQSITVSSPGSYTVTVINTAGCTATSNAANVTIDNCTIYTAASGRWNGKAYIPRVFTINGVNNTSSWNGYDDLTSLSAIPFEQRINVAAARQRRPVNKEANREQRERAKKQLHYLSKPGYQYVDY